MEDVVAKYSRVVHYAVNASEPGDGGIDDALAAFGCRDAFGIRDRRATTRRDLVNDLLGWPPIAAAPVGGAPGIVDDDVAAFCGSKQRNLAADSSTRPGDYYDFY